MPQKLYCTHCNVYSDFTLTPEIVNAEVELPLPATSGEDRIHEYFDKLKCPTCGSTRYQARDCGCVQVESAGLIDIVTCEFHKGWEAAYVKLIGSIINNNQDRPDAIKPLKIEDDAVNLKPGLGEHLKCGCWKLKDESGRHEVFTYYCDFDRGFRHFVRCYRPFIDGKKYVDEVTSKMQGEAILCLLARVDYERAQIMHRSGADFVANLFSSTIPKPVIIDFATFMYYWNMALETGAKITIGYGLHEPRNVAETVVNYA